ncbi:peptidylprolyl isomerase [Salinibacterium sp. G-O1]|uniref:peptidylprolyl isomerase n=1 Tax=Salinibacterium sp. G-O1 TaxID=3046208 RepID=UPI0024BBA6A1|nr:peptidylprolyl isomerase [Salinibacterium sp. G-O1]MDJ0335210.1 peptidylprolyl isomerase [Salinibacterium sp. G-O1]
MASSKSTEREAREARERLRRYNARQTVHEQGRKRRTRDNIVAVIGVLAIAALATGAQLFYFNGGPGTATPVPSATPEAIETPAPEQQNVGDVPDPSVAEARTWTGELTLNDVPLGITLDGALAPQAVASIVTDAQSGYYIGKSCHRLVSTESAGLIQCGSLDGTGASDPSYSFGPLENTAASGVYPAGTIAMARSGNDAYSNGRQFFIVFADATLPDDTVGGYTIVGNITSGLDQFVAAIADAGVADGAADGAPVVATSITGLTIQ